jgi:hypothetical protein
MGIQIKIVGDMGVALKSDPGLNDANAEPDIVVILSRITAILDRKCFRVPL